MFHSAPKVIKVVNLKRFRPETPEPSKLKRTKHGPSLDSKYSNTKETIDNTYHHNEHTETEHTRSMVEKSSDTQNFPKSYQMQVSNRSKIKFRKCSHTLEELSTLHEHTGDTLVKVGDTFDTRDALKEYLNENAKIWHYYYVCRNSKKKIIEYNCICMAYNVKQREVVIRRQKKRTTACPCKIRLTIDEATHKVVVYYVCNHHDHPTTANAFYHYPHAKYLPQHVKEEFLDLTYLGLDVELIQKYIHSVIGLTIKKKDIWSYSYRFKRNIFKRSITDERQKYVEDLMIKIKETYGECDTTSMDRTNEHSEIVEYNNEDETKRQQSLVNVQSDNITTGILSEDMNINYEESLLQEVLGDSGIDNTEVIVQYINQDGILCNKNGVPVTNSTAIIQFINNYTYVAPEKDLEQTVLSKLVDSDSIYEMHPIDWESLQNESAIENSAYVKDSEGPVLNDTVADDSMNVESLEHDAEESHEKLLPTPASAATYAAIDNFKKYYYVDHRYIALEQDTGGQHAAPYKAVCHGKESSNSSGDPSLEKYIEAPDFVCYPTPIRHCSGHDHLTLLTDADAIRPGAKFLTHQAFLDFTNERASRWFFYYSLVESARAPENYVYKCVYGKSRVSKNAYRAKGLRRRKKLTTQCPCQIRLRRLVAEPAYLTVLYSCNHHDHGLDERHFGGQPHGRRLPARIREEVKDLITLRAGFDIIRKYVAAVTGVRVYGKYFHNVRAGMRARGERRRYTEQQLAMLTEKIRDLEATYGNAAEENPEAISQNQTKKRLALQEYCELSDKDDFAEEVCIVQIDTLLAEDAPKQSRLETRLQNLPRHEILINVKKLQESVRSCRLRSNASVPTYVSYCIGDVD